MKRERLLFLPGFNPAPSIWLKQLRYTGSSFCEVANYSLHLRHFLVGKLSAIGKVVPVSLSTRQRLSAEFHPQLTEGSHWLGSWLGPRAGLDITEKKIFLKILTHRKCVVDYFIFILIRCTVHLLSFCTMTNKFTIISQIITLLYVSTLSCHPQTACNQYLAKLHQYFKCSCW